MTELENENTGKMKSEEKVSKEKVYENSSSTEQLALFEVPNKENKSPNHINKVVDEIKDLNILDMNPLQAMNFLYEVQKKLRK